MTASRFVKEKGSIRKRLLKYTRLAFRMLPEMGRPRMLDIGCGSGVPTLELARLTKGEIVGLDIDQNGLRELVRQAEEGGLSDRVRTVRASLFDMPFPAGSFDVIWAEGSISALGFERGLLEWERLLKPGGFLAVHDERGDVAIKLGQISACGYELLGWFAIGQEVWGKEYFSPLEELIEKTATPPGAESKLLEAVRVARREIEWFKKDPGRSNSAFFVMRKMSPPSR
jgi:SAM-dependent methyltransferase